jgi:carbamoyltransferase
MRGRSVNVLGINSVYHESAAALTVDGEVVAACEEERFTRVKHAKVPQFDNPQELPEHAIRACLDQAGIAASAIDYVAYSFNSRVRRATFCADWWPDPRWEEVFLQGLGRVRGAAEKLLGRKLGRSLKFVPHHLAHAASAFYPSGFDRAAILVIDGIGEAACTTLLRGDGARIRTIETISYPHSLGFLWEVMSRHLGFSQYDASKVMGLAAYGEPKMLSREFASILRVGEDDYAVDPDAAGFRSAQSGRLKALLGPPRDPGAEILPHHAHIAAALQEVTNAAVAALLRRLKRAVPLDHLCLAGGVGLNCVTNAMINQSETFSDIFIPSAPHDAGTATGAALAVHCANAGARPAGGDATAFLGPQFDTSEILAAVKAAGLTARRSRVPAREAADMIAGGKIVAWFQGRMEFGPRALGNRSLLADPRPADMRDILNRKVKHRESFRPFAPSVLAERAEEWFDVGPRSLSHDYMLFACPAKAERRGRIPAVVHRDGTARLQLVRREANPRFHELISCFAAKTGVPLVLNTSFNDSEPIVCTPAHAIATFRNTRIDALFMDDVCLTART